jgi:hypothetical protein
LTAKSLIRVIRVDSCGLFSPTPGPECAGTDYKKRIKRQSKAECVDIANREAGWKLGRPAAGLSMKGIRIFESRFLGQRGCMQLVAVHLKQAATIHIISFARELDWIFPLASVSIPKFR